MISALGPVKGDKHLHATLAPAMVAAMDAEGVGRFIGVSGAGIDVLGDRKRTRDRLISKAMSTFGGAIVGDKTAELQVLAASDLGWTLVRPPRLTDGPASRDLEHDAHLSTRSSKITRANLAIFVADVLDQKLYVRQAPFAACR